MKNDLYTKAPIYPSFTIELSVRSILKRLKTQKSADKIHEMAQEKINQIQDLLKPSAVVQWFDFDLDQKTGIGRIRKESGELVFFHLGCSGTFLEAASHVMVNVHSIGEDLDKESTKASARGDLLEAYIIDLIGLVALEKTSDIIKKMAEEQARQMGWGVGPFLSPGAVHGWALEEQSKLCQLLPINKISVTMKSDSVLYPLKTIAGLIGIGPAYVKDKVGSTCEVCSKKDICQMNLAM